MTESDKLFTDAEAYERMMGRWSHLVAKTFLDWVVRRKISDGSMSVVETVPYGGADRSLYAGSGHGGRSIR